MKLSDRINVSCMLVSNYTEHSKDRCTVFDVAILTEDRKYVEYELVTRGTSVTPDVQSQYMSLMSEYRLAPSTRIYFQGIDCREPVCMIFKAFAQPLGIKIYNIGPERMLKRICHVHPNLLNRYDKKTGRYRRDKEPKKQYLQQVWRGLVRRGLCPWITEAYDQHLKKRGYREYRYRKQLLRMGMFYMLELVKKQKYDAISRGRRRTAARPAADAQSAMVFQQPDPAFRTGLFS